MCEKILATVEEYMGEKVKLSKGILAAVTFGAFILGIIIGSCAAKSKKPVVVKTSDDEEFDADEYVRNLSFDEE